MLSSLEPVDLEDAYCQLIMGIRRNVQKLQDNKTSVGQPVGEHVQRKICFTRIMQSIFSKMNLFLPSFGVSYFLLSMGKKKP